MSCIKGGKNTCARTPRQAAVFPPVPQSFGPRLTFLLLEIIKIEQFYINVYISVDFRYLRSVVLFYLFMPLKKKKKKQHGLSGF